MSTLWRREAFLRNCSKEELTEKAQDIEVTIPVKKSQEARYNLDLWSFFENCFQQATRRPDESQSNAIGCSCIFPSIFFNLRVFIKE